MMTRIGIVAGEILTLLERSNSPVTLKEIELHVDEPVDVILMSIGWLARESYIFIQAKEGVSFVYLISLEHHVGVADPVNPRE
jgi:hypothetical protein